MDVTLFNGNTELSGSRMNGRSDAENLNPFMVDVVLCVLFDFVDYQTLQQCRLVCSKWHSLSNQFFINRSMIAFRNDAYVYRHPYHLKHIFRNYHLFPIRSYQFKNDIWPVKILEDFCKQRKRIIHDLRIENVRLMDSNWTLKKNYDVSSLITREMKKLVLDYDEERECTKLSVSLSSMIKLYHLDLQQCQVNLPETPMQLCPTKISFSNVLFFFDGEEMPALRLNEFLDFQQMEDMKIVTVVGRNVGLDLGCGKVRMKRLHLDGITCWNAGKSTWEIKKLTLGQIIFTVTFQISVKVIELNIEHTSFDFSMLPSSVQRLTLYNVAIPSKNMSPNLRSLLPNLKRLSLKLMYVCMFKTILQMFVDCDKLFDVELCSPVINLDINYIPRNVRTLKLSGGVNISGEGMRYFKRLVVECHEFANIASLKLTLSKLQSEYLSFVSFTSNPRDFVEMFPDRDFVIGECILEDDSDETIRKNSTLLQYVDEISSYYFFKHGQGIAITQHEFNSYTNLNFNY